MSDTADTLKVVYTDLDTLATTYEQQAMVIADSLKQLNRYLDLNIFSGPTAWTGSAAAVFQGVVHRLNLCTEALPDAMQAAAEQIRSSEASYVETDADRVRQLWFQFIADLEAIAAGH